MIKDPTLKTDWLLQARNDFGQEIRKTSGFLGVGKVKDFNKKIVVITGAGAGMGRAYALEFSRLGARLALNDYDDRSLQETILLVKNAYGAEVFGRTFDVSNNLEMQVFAEEVMKQFGNAHVVINNAGVPGNSTPIWAASRDVFDRTMKINFDGVLNGTLAFLPQLMRNTEGALVNVASVFGLLGVPGGSDYCASKFAVRGFTESLITELMHTSVSVHVVCPGGIKTDIAGATDVGREFTKKYLKTAPEVVARSVVRAIKTGEPLVVVGHQSGFVHMLSRFAPAGTKRRMLFNTMVKPVLGTPEYTQGPRRYGSKRGIGSSLSIVLALSLIFSALNPSVGAFAYDMLTRLQAEVRGLKKEFVDIGEMKFATYQRGPKNARSTVVLVHGFTSDKSVWIPFSNSIHPYRRVLTPDLAGHGESGFDASWNYSAGAQAQRLAKLLDKLEIDKVTLIGSSMVGNVNSSFAASYTERNQALVLIDPEGLSSPTQSETAWLFSRGESPFVVKSQEDFRKLYAMNMAQPPYVPVFLLE